MAAAFCQYCQFDWNMDLSTPGPRPHLRSRHSDLSGALSGEIEDAITQYQRRLSVNGKVVRNSYSERMCGKGLWRLLLWKEYVRG